MPREFLSTTAIYITRSFHDAHAVLHVYQRCSNIYISFPPQDSGFGRFTHALSVDSDHAHSCRVTRLPTRCSNIELPAQGSGFARLRSRSVVSVRVNFCPQRFTRSLHDRANAVLHATGISVRHDSQSDETSPNSLYDMALCTKWVRAKFEFLIRIRSAGLKPEDKPQNH